jgi:haloacetate dehalogenase
VSDDLFPGFTAHWLDTQAGRIFARKAGSGPPLVLLHGFPQTHAIWHRLAPALAETHTVVALDLRGYGWSSAPQGSSDHATYSKRAMGDDVVAVMDAFGHARFALAGHDRGARVGYRLALDHPGRIERLALLDILPTFEVWRQIEAETGVSPHWRFLAEREPVPEAAIGRDPIGYYEGLIRNWSGSGTLEAFDPRALTAYRQSWNEPSRIHASCEDYRAGATLDREADKADRAAGRTILCPVHLVWSRGYLGRNGDPVQVWRDSLAPAIGGTAVSGGHFVAEEAADETLAALKSFLASPA